MDLTKGYRPLIEDGNTIGLWPAPAAVWESQYAHKLRGFNKRWITFLVSVFIALLVLVSYRPREITRTLSSTTSSSAPGAWPSAVLVNGTTFLKPRDFKLIGILFFGRRASVSILECYLRANLVSHGGFLDEMHFVVNTDKKDDIAWLDQMVAQDKDYKRVDLEGGPYPKYNPIYDQVFERNHMYIKMDDDMVRKAVPLSLSNLLTAVPFQVWMNPLAIPELVNTKLNQPESFVVLGSLINSATMAWVQYRLGAVYSYLPERRPPVLTSSPQGTDNDSYGPKAWRASALPTWQSADGERRFEEFPQKPEGVKKAPIGSDFGPPYANHRWLPLRDEDRHITETPIAHSQYNPFGQSWRQWTIAAQQHYSLLENLEKGLVSKYYVGHDGVWNL